MLGSVADGLNVCKYGPDPVVATDPIALFKRRPRPLYTRGNSIVPPAISNPSNVLTAKAAEDCDRCVVLSRSCFRLIDTEKTRLFMPVVDTGVPYVDSSPSAIYALLPNCKGIFSLLL